MAGLQNWARGSACLALSFCACAPDVLWVDYGCSGLDPGALVVTEVQANPDGRDGDLEYIEVYNGGSAPISLVGVTVAASRSDGDGLKSHQILEGSVPSDGYFVLGKAPEATMPGHVDYSYGEALGSLRNSEGTVSLWCGEQLVDRVSYAKTTDGRALELDGRLSPDHETNDDPSAWCSTPEGAGAMGDANFGTPGRRNSPCESAPVSGQCVDGELVRQVVAPRAEDVSITEWMPNPKGSDAELEWVELRFDAEADLDGLQLGPSEDELAVVIDGESCFPVDAGTRVVFGASPAAAPRVDAELGFSLGNSGARSIVVAIDDVVLDQVGYDETAEGVAWQIDEEGDVCLADGADEYASGNFGTPGGANPVCMLALEPWMCLDGGVPREIVSPRPGQAYIAEWMADPDAVGHREGEWVELRLGAAVDLNGITLEDRAASATTLSSESCLHAEAGAHVVLARELDPLLNGGIVDALSKLSLSLNDRDETLTLSVDGEILDVVTYARSEPGAATQVDERGSICVASMPYGDGDLGTPGLPNPWCN